MVDQSHAGSVLGAGLRMFFVGLAWATPLILLFAGWLYPPMRQPISLTTAPQPEVFAGLFFSVLVVGGWMVFDWFRAMKYTTPVVQLQLDCFVSALNMLILSVAAGWLMKGGEVPYWFVLPWLGTVADTVMTAHTSINNAAQKPLMQTTKGG